MDNDTSGGKTRIFKELETGARRSAVVALLSATDDGSRRGSAPDIVV